MSTAVGNRKAYDMIFSSEGLKMELLIFSHGILAVNITQATSFMANLRKVSRKKLSCVSLSICCVCGHTDPNCWTLSVKNRVGALCVLLSVPVKQKLN